MIVIDPQGDPLRNDKRSWRRRPWIEPPASRLRFGLRDFWRGPALVLTACWLHAAAVTPWAADDRPKR